MYVFHAYATYKQFTHISYVCILYIFHACDDMPHMMYVYAYSVLYMM